MAKLSPVAKPRKLLKPKQKSASTSGSSPKTSWWVYILRGASGRFYTGVSTDPPRRVEEHNGSPRGAKYTRAGRPWTLVYQEGPYTRGSALSREYAIKRLPRSKKQELISWDSKRSTPDAQTQHCQG